MFARCSVRHFCPKSVCGGWTTLTEVRKWAAVDDDALWAQFAHQLGDEKFDNVSIMAALQTSDIKEAVEATQGTPITRAKLRLVFAVARMMFELDPVDVGAPPVPSQPAELKTAKASRSDGGLSMRVKVSSILDQSSNREVERISREDLNALRGRFRSLEGEDPMKAEEVTDDQLSVLAAVRRQV